jgi:predicted nucleic acid-binding protein
MARGRGCIYWFPGVRKLPQECREVFAAPVRQAVQAVQLYRQIPIRWVEVELEEALKIANELGVSAYDAYLIRCALKYKAPLLSVDRELIRAAKRAKARAIEVVP